MLKGIDNVFCWLFSSVMTGNLCKHFTRCGVAEIQGCESATALHGNQSPPCRARHGICSLAR